MLRRKLGLVLLDFELLCLLTPFLFHLFLYLNNNDNETIMLMKKMISMCKLKLHEWLLCSGKFDRHSL